MLPLTGKLSLFSSILSFPDHIDAGELPLHKDKKNLLIFSRVVRPKVAERVTNMACYGERLRHILDQKGVGVGEGWGAGGG